MKKKQSRHTHVDQVVKIISVVVVYEQGVGLKSSITVDTASRKDLTLQGCTNCPLWTLHARPSLSVATHHRQPFYNLVPRDPKRQVPLTNNEQNPGGPRGVDTQPKIPPRSRIGLFRMAKVGVSLTYITGYFPSSPVWTKKGTMSLLARVVLKPLVAD